MMAVSRADANTRVDTCDLRATSSDLAMGKVPAEMGMGGDE